MTTAPRRRLVGKALINALDEGRISPSASGPREELTRAANRMFDAPYPPTTEARRRQLSGLRSYINDLSARGVRPVEGSGISRF